MKTFNLNLSQTYTSYFTGQIEIKANSEEEAKAKLLANIEKYSDKIDWENSLEIESVGEIQIDN
jgi:hypothetical protein